MLYIVIFFIAFLIYAALFLLNSKVAISYSRNKHHEGVVVSFYVGKGRLRFDHNIVLGENDNQQTKFLDYLKDNATIFKRIGSYLKKKRSKVELEIRILQGTDDAALTGLLCGLLWALAGNILSYLSRYLKIFKEEIVITPSFQESVLEVDINCIFHTKLAHIIVVLIKIYYTRRMIRMEAKKTIGGEVSG